MDNGFLGAGDLYIDRRDSNGNLTGLKLIGAGKFELHTESELKEQIGKGRSNYGQVINSATLPGKTTLAATLSEVDRDTLALAFLGSASGADQAAGTVAAGSPEAIVARVGRYVELAHENVSSLVVKNEAEDTTYAEGSDYEFSARLGMFKALPGGSIADGAVLHLSYSYGSVSRSRIIAADSPIIRARVVLDGINYANEKDVKVVVDRVRLKPASAVDFLADDFLPLELEGLCEVEGTGSPFEIFYYD